MVQLLEKDGGVNAPQESWYVESEEELNGLPVTTPIGSTAIMPTDNGLVVKIRCSNGAWKDI